MDDKALIKFQRQQISSLQEEKSAAMEALDLARELGTISSLSNPQSSLEMLLQEICDRANKMIPFKSCAVYLIDNDTQDFVQARSCPEYAAARLEKEVGLLIEDQSFAYALQSDGPVFFLDSAGDSHIFLHTLLTPSRVRGMFVGVMVQSKEDILDTTLKLFSVFMLSAANALENCETREFMRNHSQELERKVQQRTLDLADAFDRLDVTLDGMQAGVMVVEAEDHKIVDANPKALEMLGVGWEELIGRQCFDVICSAFRGNCPITDRGLNEDNGEYVIERRDGVSIPIQKTVSRVMINGKLHMVENFIDISEQKKLADLKEDVDRIMRHDLKGPLNGIIGLPDILLMDDEGNLTESQREILEYIQASGYKLLNMINLSLDLYKMETGAYEYHPAVADVYALARSVLKDLFELINYKKLVVREQFGGKGVEKGFSFNIRCDEFLTYSLLSNLLKNAVEASPAESVITLDVNDDLGDILIKIHNMGVVPEDIRDTFFEKYVTAHKSGGTGLGTYSAKLIAETMGGSVSFESSDVKGTSIFIKLPGIED
ncbi:GAF domain-containing protein [Desulfovibrio sp. JC022]|uniref:GAF domain-containing protein n=1 Tax=Desulfovibrio sp. JC022 TaxID=2593642 RepID=UPI0013D37EB0|nr:GAF domain-containing protein [Desulfovibrio sp. JC022]NDV23283.1 PAS domain-containing protein [Desulfovibrio sp. JC022]